MKKVFAILLMIALLFSSSGCFKVYTDQAPILYITLGDQVIERVGMIDQYERIRFPFLKRETQLFSHPFALEGDMIPIEYEGKTISLCFDEQPKTMWLQYYKDGDVSESHTTEAMPIESNGDEWTLQKGKNIYELFATWENSISNRTARYVFCIETK